MPPAPASGAGPNARRDDHSDAARRAPTGSGEPLPRGVRRAAWLARLLGILLLVAAPIWALTTPYFETHRFPVAAALAVVGALLLGVLREPLVTARGTGAAITGAAASLDDALAGLGLAGHGIYVPSVGNLDRDGLFVPAATGDAPELPRLDPGRARYTAKADGVEGVLVAPPGLALLDDHAADQDVRLDDAALPEAEALLSGVGAAHGLFGGLSIGRDPDGAFRVEHRPKVATPCLGHRGPDPPSCVRAGCLVCSLLCAGLARTVGRPLSVQHVEAGAAQGTVILRLIPVQAPPGGVA